MIKNITANPNVLTYADGSRYTSDLLSELLKNRIILVNGEVESSMAGMIVAQLTYLHAQDATAPITMYIDSPGGSVTAGMSIIDTMKYIGNPIITVNVGMAASMGAMILLSGTKGLRLAYPHSTTMIHQPLGGAQGQATEIEIVAKNILKTKSVINQMIADATGQALETVQQDTERDNYKDAEEAKDYGLVDAVITTAEEADKYVSETIKSLQP